MSLPLLVHSKLFWFYKGEKLCCWYLLWGDGVTVQMQNAYIDDMDRFGIDTAVLNLCNEKCSSPFIGQFMRSGLDGRKVNMGVGFILRLKARGKNIVIVDLDCPPEDEPKYPYWKYPDRIPDFIEVFTSALAPVVDGFCPGIETDRGPLSVAVLDDFIVHMQKFAFRMINGVKILLPIITHEQNVGWRYDENKGKDVPFLRRAVPIHANIAGLETSNHPHNGNGVPAATMVAEAECLYDSSGKKVWVMESNSEEGGIAKDQNNNLAKARGVIGVSGPM